MATTSDIPFVTSSPLCIIFKAGNLNDEEWFDQFRVSYDQNNKLHTENNRTIHRAQSELDFSKRGINHASLEDSLENQAQLLTPRAETMDGLNQLQGVDNVTALNDLLQQQHQQQHHHSLSYNTNQAAAVSMASTQSLEQQLAALQQQLNNQEQEIAQRHAQETRQITTTNLHENLIQLQKLQEQQHQILQKISQNTGLVDPNILMNPLGTLLSSLVEQISTNNSNNAENESIRNDLSNAMTRDHNDSSALSWRQMSGRQEVNLAENPLNSPRGMVPITQPTIQERDQQQRKRTGFLGTNNAPLEAPQPLRLPPTSVRAKEQRKRFVSDHSMNTASTRRPATRDPTTTNTNINIEFPTPPIIRKTDSRKKQKPRSFPVQLWDAMMAKNPKKDEAFEWLPDGKSFVVVDPVLFCKEILDPRFKQSKYGSFVRKLHRWGFIRLTSGTGTDCFHHPLFQKLKPELVSQIKCNNRKDNKKGHNAYARGEYLDTVQPSLMGVEKFIRTKGVVSTDNADDRPF